MIMDGTRERALATFDGIFQEHAFAFALKMRSSVNALSFHFHGPLLMQNLGRQTKSIVVVFEMAYS